MQTKKPLTFISAQPCIPYYAWQVEVMLNNFADLHILDNYHVHLLFAYNIVESDWKENVNVIKKVEEKFKDRAKFF